MIDVDVSMSPNIIHFIYVSNPFYTTVLLHVKHLASVFPVVF